MPNKPLLVSIVSIDRSAKFQRFVLLNVADTSYYYYCLLSSESGEKKLQLVYSVLLVEMLIGA